MTNNTVIVGAQWGDEGKGKIVDYLADQHDVVVRFQGATTRGIHWLSMANGSRCMWCPVGSCGKA